MDIEPLMISGLGSCISLSQITCPSLILLLGRRYVLLVMWTKKRYMIISRNMGHQQESWLIRRSHYAGTAGEKINNAFENTTPDLLRRLLNEAEGYLQGLTTEKQSKSHSVILVSPHRDDRAMLHGEIITHYVFRRLAEKLFQNDILALIRTYKIFTYHHLGELGTTCRWMFEYYCHYMQQHAFWAWQPKTQVNPSGGHENNTARNPGQESNLQDLLS